MYISAFLNVNFIRLESGMYFLNQALRSVTKFAMLEERTSYDRARKCNDYLQNIRVSVIHSNVYYLVIKRTLLFYTIH